MWHDQKEVELLATSVERAIHRSQQLVRESRMLEVRTTVFLNQWNSEPEFSATLAVQQGQTTLLNNPSQVEVYVDD